MTTLTWGSKTTRRSEPGPRTGPAWDWYPVPFCSKPEMRVVTDSRRSTGPGESRISASDSGGGGSSARTSAGIANSAARHSKAEKSQRFTGSLAAATTARRRAVSPGRAFTGVVDLLRAVGVGGLVGEAHHGIREPRASV